ncbi:MAG TPA: hypothetical protein VFD88_00930 [Clostridia bacterium]|nr:hypothetical protein [Clostridia bacterium]
MRHGVLAVVAGAAILAAFSACDLPFGLGTPTTRALESGATGTLSTATSLEIKGSYTEGGNLWSIDMQIVRAGSEHVTVSGATLTVEAIVLGKEAYFRGQAFLSQHMGADVLSRNLVKAAGNAWWKGSAGDAPQMPDLTDASAFTATFLGPSVTQRTDHVSVDGVDAVDMSGPRAEVFIAAAPPYQLLRLHLKAGVTVDGIANGDLRFGSFNRDFGIVAPSDVIDFSNLSTLPPIYTVVSVDASKCVSPCVVSALVKNLGGKSGALAPSTITFTMTSAVSRSVVGSCQRQVVPDVGYNNTATVSCTIALGAQQGNAAIVTASAENPGHA